MHDGAAARSGAAQAAGHGHGSGAALPRGQKEPGGQAAHVAFVAAPTAALQVPAAHGTASTEAKGQKEPGGQATGAPEEQKKEAGQGTQVSCRKRLVLSIV